MYTPAESAAGTAAIVRSCFSRAAGAADPSALAQPAANSAVAATALRTRKVRRIMFYSPHIFNSCIQGRTVAVQPCHGEADEYSDFASLSPLTSHNAALWLGRFFFGQHVGVRKNMSKYRYAPRARRRPGGAI